MDQADEEPEGEVDKTRPEVAEIRFHNLLLSVRSIPGDAHVHDVGAGQE